MSAMKVKTSIALSEDVLKAVDKRAQRRKQTRSNRLEAPEMLKYLVLP